jgi:hypothetical protein
MLVRQTMIVAAIFSFLAGCANPSLLGENSLKPGAEKIRISNTEPGKECQFLGEVTGSQGNLFTGKFTSNSNLETGARNDLKNKALDMGGNILVLLTQRAGNTDLSQTNVTLSANVFRCPE